jgi:acetyl/propionyl-CoA carboxylase alpha subunit
MRRAVAEYQVVGLTTTLPFFEAVLRDPEFVRGDFDTGFVERFLGRATAAVTGDGAPGDETAEAAVVAAAVQAFREGQAARLQAPAAGGSGISAWRALDWRALGPFP